MLDQQTQSATRALRYLYDGVSGAVEVCGLSHSAVAAEHFDASEIADATAYLESLNERGYRAYFGLQPRHIDLVGNGRRASDRDVEQAICVGLDFDDGDALKTANNTLFKSVKPSLIIRTGTAPTNRAWVIWAFDTPQPIADWTDITKQLAEATGADSAACNPSRIARCPGFLTMPPTHKIERGYKNEIATLHHIAEDRYDAATLRAALTAYIQAQPQAPRGADPLTRKVSKFSGLVEPLNIDALKDNCRANVAWNSSMWRLVGHWVRQGLSDADIATLARPLTAPGYSEQQTEAEVGDMIARTRDRQGVQPTDIEDTPQPRTEKKTRSRGLTLFRPEEMIYTGPQPMLLEGLIPLHGVGFIAADSHVGKSFFSIGASVAISAGAPFLGIPTQQAFCLYVGLEGKAELQNRFAAAFAGQGVRPEDCQLAFASGDLSLSRDDDLDALAEMYESARGEAQHGLLIIDTFSQAIAGEKENDADAMSEVVRKLTWLADHLQATVLACHHTTKNTVEPRGSSVLRGNTDVVILMERQVGEKTIKIWTSKQRDGAPCEPFEAEITDVELTSPETGEVGAKGYIRRIACAQPKRKGSEKLTNKEQKIYQALLRCDPEKWRKNRAATKDMPADIWYITQEDFVRFMLDYGVVSSGQTGRSHISNIVNKGHIKKVGDYIWNVSQEQFEGGKNEHF